MRYGCALVRSQEQVTTDRRSGALPKVLWLVDDDSVQVAGVTSLEVEVNIFHFLCWFCFGMAIVHWRVEVQSWFP